MTDVDLCIDSVLDIVMEYINCLRDGSVPQGMEMWVHEGQAQKSKSKSKHGFLVRCQGSRWYSLTICLWQMRLRRGKVVADDCEW
jgi:hypothetical protein